MKNIMTIIKKELSRVFKDKRLVFTTILMPGLMIFLMYSFMGEAISGLTSSNEGKTPIVATINAPADFKNTLDLLEFNYSEVSITNSQLEQYKQMVYDSEIDYIIVFPENFNPSKDQVTIPNINTYYNPSNDLSDSTNSVITNTLNIMLDTYTKEQFDVTQLFTINLGNESGSIIMDEDKMMGRILSMLLPFLIIIFLFSGAMGVAPESIAGDKERGTMATLLVTPINRSEIALGKVTALSIISILSAISSFIGIIASLPKLMGIDDSMSTNIYGFKEYIVLFFILLVTVLIIVGLISVVSAYAKNLKESNMMVLPLYFIVMALGITTMFSSSSTQSWYLYLIPIYNSLQCMVGVFTFDFNLVNLLITIFVNLAYTICLIYLLTKMFKSEKIMFSK